MPGRWTSLGRSPSHRSNRSFVLSPPPQPSGSRPIRACTGPSCTSTSPFHSLTSQLRLRLLLPPTFRLIFVLEKTGFPNRLHSLARLPGPADCSACSQADPGPNTSGMQLPASRPGAHRTRYPRSAHPDLVIGLPAPRHHGGAQSCLPLRPPANPPYSPKHREHRHDRGLLPTRHSRNQVPVMNLGARASRPLCHVAGLWRRTFGPRLRAGRPRSQEAATALRAGRPRSQEAEGPRCPSGRDARAPRDPTLRNQSPIGG